MEIDDFKCYNCGKKFKTATHLKQHKNRKTPCLIREIAPELKNDPRRCIYCNKVFSTVFNLNKHHSVCKVKNGGMDTLAEKVHYEERLRALELERERDKRQLEAIREENQELRDQLDDVWTRFEEVEKGQIVNVQNNNNTLNMNNVGNTTNTNNLTLNIHIHRADFDNPCTEGLMPTPEELVAASKEKSLIDYSLKRIYFSPKKPVNHSFYLNNKKTFGVIAFKSGDWRSYEGDNSREATGGVLTCADRFSRQIVEKYGMDDKVFNALPAEAKAVIREFNRRTTNLAPGTRLEDIFPLSDVYNIALEGREIVRESIKSSGCKLIK